MTPRWFPARRSFLAKVRRSVAPEGILVRDQERTFAYAAYGPIPSELLEAFNHRGTDELYVWARLQDWAIELDLDMLPPQVQSW